MMEVVSYWIQTNNAYTSRVFSLKVQQKTQRMVYQWDDNVYIGLHIFNKVVYTP